MDINYELYKVFYYVATTLSFSEASKLLFISQSAVSQSIKVLEKKLGITLFIRSTKRVQLTPEGETLLRHVEPAINLIARGEAQIMEAGTLGGGQLRIGASDTICRYFLVPYLNRFHRSFPNVHIKVTNQTSTQCVDLLESGQVDFIVTNYPNSHLSSRLQTIPIHSFHDIFIANGEYYPELENRPVHLKELLQYPILMLDRKSTTSEFLHSQFQPFQCAVFFLHPAAECLLAQRAVALSAVFIRNMPCNHARVIFEHFRQLRIDDSRFFPVNR